MRPAAGPGWRDRDLAETKPSLAVSFASPLTAHYDKLTGRGK
jgi:hypothetical protein